MKHSGLREVEVEVDGHGHGQEGTRYGTVQYSTVVGSRRGDNVKPKRNVDLDRDQDRQGKSQRAEGDGTVSLSKSA